MIDGYKEVLKKVNNLVDAGHNDELEWEVVYSLVFSENISRKVDLDYYDPDCDYIDDVLAFQSALQEKITQLSKIDDIINRN